MVSCLALTCRAWLRRRRLRRGRRRPDHHRHLPAADRRLLRAGQGRAARLRGLGRDRQRERRPARPPGRAEDPRRPVQRRQGRLRLREADQPGRGRPGLRALLDPPRRARRTGGKDYGFLFVEPAGAAEEVFTQGFDNLFYAAPAVADDHYNYLAEHILAMPEAERPKTAAYAAMDDPFAMGTAYGLKEKLEAAGIQTVVDEVYPPDTTDFGGIAAKIADAKADIMVGGIAVPGRGEPDRRAAAARLPAQDGGVLHRADEPRVPRGDRREDRGHPLPHRLHARGDVADQRGVRRELHRAERHPAGRGRGQRVDDRPGRRRGRRGRRVRRAPTPSASSS